MKKHGLLVLLIIPFLNSILSCEKELKLEIDKDPQYKEVLQLDNPVSALTFATEGDIMNKIIVQISDGLNFDPMSYSYDMPGTMLTLELYTPIEDNLTTIASGSYNGIEGTEIYHFKTGSIDYSEGFENKYGTYITQIKEDGSIISIPITGGNVQILAGEDNQYTFEMTLFDEEMIEYHVSFSNTIHIIKSQYYMEKPEATKDNIEFSVCNRSENWGTWYGQDSFNYLIDLKDKNNKYFMGLELNGPVTDDGNLAEGTYTISEERKPYTACAGKLRYETGIALPCYYGSLSNGARTSIKWITEGEITVSKDSDGTYTITFDVSTSQGSTLNGSFVGKLEFEKPF